MMLASVIQWKKHHPTFTTEVYLDKLSLDLFTKLNILDLWDSHKLLGKNKAIDKDIFWASSKLQALRFIDEPIILMDNDFVVYKNFEKYLNNEIVATHFEDGNNYYVKPLDPYIRQVRHLINRPKLEALNCSFLYLPDPMFTQTYAKLSLELMIELTKLKVPNSTYLIYAEQLLLKHLINIHKIPYKTLLDKEFYCKDRIYTKQRQGYIETEKHNLYFRHYWMDKNNIRESKQGFSYKEEIQQLENIVNVHKLIDWTIINV